MSPVQLAAPTPSPRLFQRREAEEGVAGQCGGGFIGAALGFLQQAQGFAFLWGQVALIGVYVVDVAALFTVEAGRGGVVGAPGFALLIPPCAAQAGGGFVGRKGGAIDQRGAKFTPFMGGVGIGLLSLMQRHARGYEERGGGSGREGGGGGFDAVGQGGIGEGVSGALRRGGVGGFGLFGHCFGRAEHVEIGGEILRDDAGEGGVGAFGRTVGHAVEAGEHRHGEAVVVAVAGDFACVRVFADHFLMPVERAGEQIVGEARAGDEDGRVPAKAKGRAVAADAQGIGGAGRDVDGVAGRGDDAGGGEGFKEVPLPSGAPAVGAALLRGGGEAVRERGEVVGHGQSSFLWEGLPGRYNR